MVKGQYHFKIGGFYFIRICGGLEKLHSTGLKDVKDMSPKDDIHEQKRLRNAEPFLLFRRKFTWISQLSEKNRGVLQFLLNSDVEILDSRFLLTGR